jgi:hypothetical protein
MKTLLVAFFTLIFSAGIYAQDDAHYWSSDYSTGGFFLPGAVIANNSDSGVYFYNPALFALVKKPTISINATIYQYQSIKIPDGAGVGRDLNSSLVNSVPQMLAGSFLIKGKKSLLIAYALIRSPSLAYNTSQRRDEKFDVLNDKYSPGDEYFVGQYVQQNNVSESSGQISTGFKLSGHLSAGFTLEADMHKQSYNITYNARALVNPGGDTTFPMVSNEDYYLATYTNIGGRIKMGLAYDDGPHHLGLTVYTPLLHIAGTATILSDNVVNNMEIGNSDIYINYLASSRQTSLPVQWKVPFSIALGYNYTYRKGQLYFASEYFPKVNEYNIVTPRNDYFIRPDTGNNNQLTSALLRLREARKAVINFAAGNSFHVRENIDAYIALRTDFSYADKSLFGKGDGGFTAYTSYWNNIRGQFGANIKKAKFNLRVGLTLAYGSTKEYPQEINFDHPDESNFLLGNTTNVKATHFSSGVIISYIHNL